MEGPETSLLRSSFLEMLLEPTKKSKDPLSRHQGPLAIATIPVCGGSGVMYPSTCLWNCSTVGSVWALTCPASKAMLHPAICAL
eukprot:16438532-Heterocapsa_arctica.AAC.1